MLEVYGVVPAHYAYVALGAGFGTTGFSKGEDTHGAVGYLPALLKIQETDGVQAHVAVVGDGQRDAEAVVAHIVIIPFLESGETALDLRAVIDRHRLRRTGKILTMFLAALPPGRNSGPIKRLTPFYKNQYKTRRSVGE